MLVDARPNRLGRMSGAPHHAEGGQHHKECDDAGHGVWCVGDKQRQQERRDNAAAVLQRPQERGRGPSHCGWHRIQGGSIGAGGDDPVRAEHDEHGDDYSPQTTNAGDGKYR